MKLLLLSLLPLAVMMVSDVKSRTVSSGWLLAFAVILWGGLYLTDGFSSLFMRVESNVLLLALLGIALMCYAKMRRRKLFDLLGSGDVWFLLALIPYFEVDSFLCYLIVSSVVSLLAWFVFQQVQPNLIGVPFVSVSGGCWAILLIMRVLYGV